MIKLDQSFKLTHTHLGDMINVIQVHRMKKCGIFSDENQELLNSLLGMFTTNLYYESSSNPINVSPTWEKKTQCPAYFKERKSETKNHIVCHFDSGSGKHYKEIDENTKQRILKRIGKKTINVGRWPIEGIVNKHDCCIEEKFEIVAAAKMVIGIDDGIAHLAETTHTKNIIIKLPNHSDIYRIYPLEANIVPIEEILNVI